MGLPIIQINNVTKSFETKDSRVEALKGISLEINRGDIYGIIGMSGAGKSTLVRCLNFLEKPTEGTVLIEGQDLSSCSDEATSALDPTTTRSILALLKEINQKYGITIVIITHEMGVVQEICSHVAIIEQGELAETGTVE